MRVYVPNIERIEKRGDSLAAALAALIHELGHEAVVGPEREAEMLRNISPFKHDGVVRWLQEHTDVVIVATTEQSMLAGKVVGDAAEANRATFIAGPGSVDYVVRLTKASYRDADIEDCVCDSLESVVVAVRQYLESKQ